MLENHFLPFVLACDSLLSLRLRRRSISFLTRPFHTDLHNLSEITVSDLSSEMSFFGFSIIVQRPRYPIYQNVNEFVIGGAL